ncbi:MAG: hypothetical protein Q9191_008444, partial [Dirinaria sp. TL-2023a]
MRVLLLGATGNVGSRLLPALLAHSHTVTVLVRSESKLRSLIPSPLLSKVSIVTGDASSSSTIAETLKTYACNALINAAGQASVLPFQAPKMQHIIRAVAQGCLDSGLRIRAWFLGGMTVLDYPSFPGTRIARYFPLFVEHEQTFSYLSSLPPPPPTSSSKEAGLEWSIFCPSVMNPKNKSIPEEVPERGNPLLAQKDTPAGFAGWGVDWIPGLGP